MLAETGIFGYATGAVSGSTLGLNVARFGRRPVTDFAFTVGTTVTADPTDYLVNVSTLGGSLASVTPGTPIAVRGIVTPITTPAGQANANAITVADRSALAAVLNVGWPLGTAKPFTQATSSGLDLDLASSLRRTIDQGFISPVQLQAADQPKVVPLANAPAPLYGIVQNGALTVSTDFASWEADLAGRIANGAKGRSLVAVGKYDAASLTLSAGRAAIFLQ